MTGGPGGQTPDRARARDLGIAPGRLLTGPANAITDVPGVRVGHATVIEGTGIRTGVTAIVHDVVLPRASHDSSVQHGLRVAGGGTLPAGLSVFNGFGKMVGSTQVAELGTIETPVLLTATLSVFRVADALLSYLHDLSQLHEGHGGEPAGTLNPVVAETNDGYLSDIWARPVAAEHVRSALDTAAGGLVEEGCVGAGTGTGALGFKAGIGTSSRIVSSQAGQVTLGVLVQANFGGELTVLGVPVPATQQLPPEAPDQGNSCVIVLATDSALDARQLRRVASRAFAGMARTGSDFSGRSGDYALAFSVARPAAAAGAAPWTAGSPVSGQDLDLLFQAAIEATEEAILNSLFMAVTTTGFRGHVRHAVPLDQVLAQVSGRRRES